MKRTVVLLLMVVASVTVYGQELSPEVEGYRCQISKTGIPPSTSMETVWYPHGWKLVSVQRMGLYVRSVTQQSLVSYDAKVFARLTDEEGHTYVATFLISKGE
jgi:hypothetical protein